MIDIDQVIKETTETTGIEYDIVNAICKHVFKFTADIIKDEDDTQDILFNKLFKFKLKPRFKTNKRNNYSPKHNDYENEHK